MPPRRKTADPCTAITYVRVSTEDQVDSGLGLDDQRAKVRSECERRGWRVVGEHADEGISAKTVVDRPGLMNALERLDARDAGNLIVSKLDRLSRSVHDFTGLVDRSKRMGWSLVVLDLGVDTSTPSGAMMANVLASFAQFERELIGQRTSDALQVKKRAGVRLGRPQRSSLDVVRFVARQRAAGFSLAAVAAELNETGVPTSQGGRMWYPSTIAAVLRRGDAIADMGA